MVPKINRTLLMSGAEYFSDSYAINALMDSAIDIDLAGAIDEHQAIKNSFQVAGINVIEVDPPAKCQDGVYTANWGLCRGDTCVLSSLPNKRQAEEPYAEKILSKLGKKIIKAPFRFSGQGDALPCGNLLFCGSNYRTDPKVHEILGLTLGYEIISLQTVPELDQQNQPVINAITGWPDSFFYDIDLAMAVITPNLIAWCPDAFEPSSQDKIRSLEIEQIEVSYNEARLGFACNLVSTGETVIMSRHAPRLKQALEDRDFKTITPEGSELSKGGGFIRCISLTLDND